MLTTNTKRALVTGGTRGIGYELVHMLLRKDYEVVFTGKTPESVKHALDKYNDSKVKGIVLDMSKPFTMQNQWNSLPYSFHTVIHNAGMLTRENLFSMNESKLQRMFSINTFYPMFLTKWYLPYMMKQRGGNVFFFCPPYKIDDKTSNLTPYMQTKLAQTTFMHSLAEMIRPHEYNIKICGFWTDYPIYTDALIYRNIGIKQNCMSTGIIAKTVELLIEDEIKNVHGHVVTDKFYLKKKNIDPNEWALGGDVKRLDDLFLGNLGSRLW